MANLLMTRIETQNTCYNESAQNIHHSRSNSPHNWENPCAHLKTVMGIGHAHNRDIYLSREVEAYIYIYIKDTKPNMYRRYRNVLNGDSIKTITGSTHVFGSLDLMRGR